jgi:DNA-binding transcriptional LysR family regulator
MIMRIPDLDLDLVRCFITVVESGSFTQAAKRLRLTQSAVTLKIKRLEDLIQRRLFLRTIKPLELSLEGEIVLGYASRLLDLNREVIQRVAGPPETNLLRLGIVEHFGYHYFPVWLSEFKRGWPNVQIVTDMGMSCDLLKGLEEERYDLVIASAGYTAMAQEETAPALKEQHLHKEPLAWTQAEDSKIDPRKDPLPLVMFGPLCHKPGGRGRSSSMAAVFLRCKRPSKLISVFRSSRRFRWFPGLNSWARTGVFPHSRK